MFVEPPLGIHRTAAGALLSIDNIVAIFHYIMSCIISNCILSNLVMITVFKFGCPTDDLPIRLMLHLKFLATTFLVHGLMVDKLSYEQVAQHSYVNVDVKQVKAMYKFFKQVKLIH